jgi:hypothetical protein
VSALFAFELIEPMDVYVPVLKAQVCVVSNQLNELSRFSQFILYAIGIGEDYDEIMRITQLGKIVIEEEIRYLIKIGLLTEEEDLTSTSLTEHGHDLYEIMIQVYAFNDRKEEVLINCLTGDLEKLNDYELVYPNERNQDVVSLKEKIIRELYQNQDPFDSRDFVFEQYEFGDLDKEQKEDIHVEIRYSHDIFYLIRRFKSVPIPENQDAFFKVEPDIEIYESSQTYEEQTYLFVERDYYKLDLVLSFDSLVNYRTVLSTLNNLFRFDSDLISKKATSLLELEKEEQELNQHGYSFYYDPVTGFCYLDVPNYPFVTNKTNTIDIKLSEEHKSSRINGLDVFRAMKKIGREKEPHSSTTEKRSRVHTLFGNFDHIFGKSHNEMKKEEQVEKDLVVEVKVIESHKVVQKVPAVFFF